MAPKAGTSGGVSFVRVVLVVLGLLGGFVLTMLATTLGGAGGPATAAHGPAEWLHAAPAAWHADHAAAVEDSLGVGARAKELENVKAALMERLDKLEAPLHEATARTSAKAKPPVSTATKKHAAAPAEASTAAPVHAAAPPAEASTAAPVHAAAPAPEPDAAASSAGGLRHGAARGKLVCDGAAVDSEVIYWRTVPGDAEYEAPTTPHHGHHHEKFLSFEYDQGGWNNIRMGVECLVVIAHAMGRTLVVPPAQNLYLLGNAAVDSATGEKTHKKLGFSDFFDLDALQGQAGYHVVTMEQFLQRQVSEAPDKRPEGNATDLWGRSLWAYMASVADAQPTWGGSVVAMPRHAQGAAGPKLSKDEKRRDADVLERYALKRRVSLYDSELQAARHIHVPAQGKSRLLQHHYSFAFFADPNQRSFYRRMVRDYMRYRDPIQCAGARLVDAVREMSRKLGHADGAYYALHIRRGDFQYKDVKISAAQIVKNLRGHEIIPHGALVYVATDDPDGTCEHCLHDRKPCPKGEAADRIPGCQADPSWAAFHRNGWNVVFMQNFTREKAGPLADVNPNYFGMVDSIVCARAAEFAGTWFSTFSGYIHRLRGYHGLGEQTYYHSTGRVDVARSAPSMGQGYAREYRAGWTDDRGDLI
ncbi:GDP-fucose protein O-fucosyltransferase-domain-containing protein [Pelagophyceae sp. CCMP2097]|nr:GDP-fucose protein O-fucosyltransferase-domain-containing protein [Pelagophyceae sp. CCMP2097]